MKVLITAGGTREPIDEVRYITNFSTGKTGAGLADIFSDDRWEVTYLCSPGAAIPKGKVNLFEYITFDDLNNQLEKKLSEEFYDAIIHASAVSDYRIDTIITDNEVWKSVPNKKISSECELTVKFKKNSKIISFLKEYSLNKKIKIIGFKLTNTSDETLRFQKIKKVSEYPGVDLVVHNDLGDMLKGKRIFKIFQNMNLICTVDSINELGVSLNSLLRKEIL
ncbi:MAG: hypothetical protein A2381_16260 [Bdellovibrionales bacterium RIFOXYB1_FULL_37_110]|nr:MAG: hypothetical protein A2181_06365 [Bdellovibrionales bacterium RIFOXYA1_FULL_38_20]OFZ48495.1 MAG: hypothetical protein A2417_04120 [Bdellovibrionales bacterium RIFOXYC1_FULL_37_79]OFZ57174.1 MAG: hypothetical protein A2381_16260 [Bdellovibrionales bacterium RIFOXYB1_FULL_37_110]OFZ63153.1 MAG: hypothetical protein A2577_15760 [Bdellovibrionales bacterium RIFOXYD1_FULL_36_51]